MKMKRLFVFVISLAMLMASFAGNERIAKADTTIILGEDNFNTIIKPGEKSHIKVPLKTLGNFVQVQNFNLKQASDDQPFVISGTKLTSDNLPTTYISNYEPSYVEFDVNVSETASIGTYPIYVDVDYTDLNNQETGKASVVFKLQVTEEKAPIQLTVSNVACLKAPSGKDYELYFTVKNEGEVTARNIYINMAFGDSGLSKGYSTDKFKVGDLDAGDIQNVKMPVKISSNATSGNKNVTVNFDYKNNDGKSLTGVSNITVRVENNNSGPKLEFLEVDYDKASAGNKFVVNVKLANTGASIAKNINISVDDSSITPDGFVKDYLTNTIKVDDIKSKGKARIEIPLVIAKQAVAGIKPLKLNLTYIDNDGLQYTASTTVYPEISGKDATPDDSQDLIISNVNQSSTTPSAGERLSVSFDIKNNSKSDIKDIKLSTSGLTGDTFIPVDSEPYIYIDKLTAGAKKRITIPLELSKKIPEGLNNLTISYTYAGSSSPVQFIIPVLNVQNDFGSGTSVPKLIISKYVTDIEELKAGSTFLLTFDITNTHASAAAKNITITVSNDTETQGVFSPTQGSNSFYISKIDPGETVQQSIELKIKSDTKTSPYKVVIDMDYEYDGMVATPSQGDNKEEQTGVKKSIQLNLQVIENARPVVDNVSVYTFDGTPVTVNMPATLYFEFYNMGKSTLNNVIATVGGDFTKADGSMIFLGNVEPGASSSQEADVMASIEGTANGILTITYEDSNGETKTLTKEFPIDVMGAMPMDPGMTDGGAVDTFAPEGAKAKKPIVPLWLFIVIQVVIFILFIPITRKIIISIYKAKLRKQEESNY